MHKIWIKNRLLGYATGTIEDIEAYFNDRMGYGLVITPLTPVDIPVGFAVKQKALLIRKEQLEEEFRKITEEISPKI